MIRRLFSWIRHLCRLPATYAQWVAYDRECTHAACCGVSRSEIHDALFRMAGNGHSRSRRTLLVIQGLWKLAACGVPERTRGMVLEGMSKRYEEWTGHPIPDKRLEKVTNTLMRILVKGKAHRADLFPFVELYPQFPCILSYEACCGGCTAESVTDWLLASVLPKHRTR